MRSNKLTIEWATGEPKLLEITESVYIASALITDWSLNFIETRLPEDSTIKILVGIHLPSDIKALEKILKLQEEGRISCRLYTSNFFHPKLYLFETDSSNHAFIGSGNFTKGGLVNNVELFHKTEELDDYKAYKKWFEEKFKEAVPFTNEHLELLKPVFEKKEEREKKSEDETKKVAAKITDDFDLDYSDLTGQFFKKKHYETLKDEYQPLMNSEILRRREDIRQKFFELHDELYPQFPSDWDLHPHYQDDHIVSSKDTTWHNNDRVSGMWLHYGRKKGEIKKYGSDKSPVQFMRLQVLLRKDSLATWLCVGKDRGSAEDREHIASELQKDDGYLDTLWNLFSSLDDDYTIRIGENRKKVSEFNSPKELKSFILNDNWHKYYFVFQKQFSPTDKAISEDNIVETILSEFEKLYPFYRQLKDKSFE